jgi:SAM-dependent methyltransferase
MMVHHRIYDAFYRWWAPWDAVGVRDELLRLLDDGEVAPATHPRVLDLGCGTGANVVELARRGFDATGVDFSPVALDKGRARAREAGVTDRCRFLEVDLTAATLPAAVDGPYDLLLDFGTLDDLRGAGREQMAAHMAHLARPGALALCWCFYGDRRELPVISFRGPSKLAAGLAVGEEHRLFGDSFEVEPFARPFAHAACFLLRRWAALPTGDHPPT